MRVKIKVCHLNVTRKKKHYIVLNEALHSIKRFRKILNLSMQLNMHVRLQTALKLIDTY